MKGFVTIWLNLKCINKMISEFFLFLSFWLQKKLKLEQTFIHIKTELHFIKSSYKQAWHAMPYVL